MFHFGQINILKEYDVFFLTYDEPNKEDLWQDLQKKIPHAKRVDGVKGFDLAHKRCAELAQTQRVVIIDGDNAFLEEKPKLWVRKKLLSQNYVISYSSANSINALTYGNGGVKCWPRHLLFEMKTHEHSEDIEAAVDFCFSVNYYQFSHAPTQTLINHSPFQAFRAGFREGVKMCLEKGLPPENTLVSFVLQKRISRSNFFRLKGWCELGRDVEHGLWAMYGARLGCLKVLQTPQIIASIRDYDWFESFWIKHSSKSEEELEFEMRRISFQLRNDYSLNLTEYDPVGSRLIKAGLKNPKREGLMYQG